VEAPARLVRELLVCRRQGAERVELCSRLDLDGLTPNPARVRLARAAWGGDAGLVALLRPRAGDFHYSRRELLHMRHQLDHVAAAGADGVALGLIRDGRLDSRPLALVVEQARGLGLKVTFHRAFDALAQPLESIDELADLGVSRVLSAGTPWGSGQSAHLGLVRLTAFQERSAGRLELVVAGGVDAALVTRASAALHRRLGTVAWHAFSSVRRRGHLQPRRVQGLVRAAR
jgi:copper homeostasis protein